MKLISCFLLAILPNTHSFSQYITDTTYFQTGKISSYGSYDSAQKCWQLYEFYPNGELSSRRKLDPVTFQDCDSRVTYNPNGRIAWILPHKDGFVSGKFEEFDTTGQLKKTGYYYRSFKTGTWQEFFPDGKLMSESYYSLSKEDSTFYRQLTKEDYERSFAAKETLSWGEPVDTTNRPSNTGYYPASHTFTYLVSSKTGIWKQYDTNGKLIRRINYDKLNKKKRTKPSPPAI
jgi:antitoxin component YwqK of YwqJK toxin-antitoxin module